MFSLKWKLFIHIHLLAHVIAPALSLLNSICCLTFIVRKTLDTRYRSNPCQITTLIILLGHEGSLEDKDIEPKATIQIRLLDGTATTRCQTSNGRKTLTNGVCCSDPVRILSCVHEVHGFRSEVVTGFKIFVMLEGFMAGKLLETIKFWKPFPQQNGFGVQLTETISTAKWFWHSGTVMMMNDDVDDEQR
ncbi:transmembrane protein, putative [Medicago truncatula]|uniref:Transmembrane protein, putative n=1 Tax=Medicago truncatula TaxID=3880 RepID=G7KDD7_MEDTR|nr:transmembrane protein, putative [Medicago truncatula]